MTAAAESALRAGHPWVYSESIREQNRPGLAGELAAIYDRKDRFLAVGFFDPSSPIRFRALHVGKPAKIDRDWWSAQLAAAVERRAGLFDDQTTGYRLINGESDGWPGLVLDRYSSTLVLKIYTAVWLPWLDVIIGLIEEQLQPERLILRSSRNIGAMKTEAGDLARPHPGPLPQERELPFQLWASSKRSRLHQQREQLLPLPGGEGRGEGGRFLTTDLILSGSREGQVLFGPPLDGPVIFQETGLKFEADVLRGQKTGFFLDQRDNRRLVETLAKGRRVLNAFSFSGGFSLYAARGGATSVTDLDISAHALASAKRNFTLNKSDRIIARCPHESVQADAFEWLAGNAQQKFDLIVLDPPSFAKREAERKTAIHAYEKLAALGISHLALNGILVACSCSAHVNAEEFYRAVRCAVARTKRKTGEHTTQHARDHPATFVEAEYLKAIWLRCF